MTSSTSIHDFGWPELEPEPFEHIDTENVPASDSLPASTSSSAPLQTFVCACAMARGRWIYNGGIPAATTVESDATGSSNGQQQWKTCLPPGMQVQQLSCNPSQTVLVAVASHTVSLIRVRDGQILATRSVVEKDQAGSLQVRVTWIPGNSNSNDKDALWIQVLAAASCEELQEDTTPTLLPSRDILITGIDGAGLNHKDPAEMAAAAQAMEVSTSVSMVGAVGEKKNSDASCSSSGNSSVRAVAGYWRTADTIRLVVDSCDAADGDNDNETGGLTVVDYSVTKKESTLVKSGITILADDWMVDYNVGFELQQQGTRTYFVCCAWSESSTAVVWFDPDSLQVACHYRIPKLQLARPKVTAVQALKSCCEETALAVAIVVKVASEAPVIQVVQFLVEECFGLTVLSSPHVVFTIPVQNTTLSLTLAPAVVVDGNADDGVAPYSFAFQLVGRDQKDCAFRAFLPSSDLVIGQIRLLLEKGQYDRADELIAATGVEPLISDTAALFHPSEVALRRMENLIGKPQQWDNPEAVEQAQDCLRRLAAGAASGNKRGLESLLETVDRVLCITSDPSLQAMIAMLSAVTLTIQVVIQALPLSSSRKLEAKRVAFQDRLTAMKLVDAAKSSLTLTAPLRTIRSPSHLFAILIRERQFAAAEQLWLSELRASLTAEVLVSALIQLDALVDPGDYMGLLSEVVLPSLAINHELLPPLRAWSCRTADALDDQDTNQHGLQAAIQLLEAVDRGTRDLQVKTHSSFASYTPFVERVESRKVTKSPRNGGSLDASSRTDFNNVSVQPSPLKSKQRSSSDDSRPNPSLLELGRLKGGATKSRRGVLVGAEEDHLYEDNEDCVEQKLREAKCLEQARFLGLGRKTSALRTFSSIGGAQFIAKELVRSFSNSAIDHDTRFEYFSHKVAPFCDTFGVSYDEALLECTLELCSGKNVSERAIQESSSIARCCSSIIIKCKATLAVLRSALSCGYSPFWLSKLSRDAISWASCDSGLQSELEEASRLLLVSGIVSKYCGSGARELFRVDNPRHAVRLLEFVTKHVQKDSVISDALSLCDAFTNLSKHDASVWLLQQAVLCGDAELCATLITQLYDRDRSLSEIALVRVLCYAEEMLNESSLALKLSTSAERIGFYKKRAVQTVSNVISLISVAMENSISIPLHLAAEIECLLEDFSLEGTKDAFSRIEELQKHHDIFMSLSNLSSSQNILETTARLLEPVLRAHTDGDLHLLNTKVTVAKRAYSLMVGDSKGNNDSINDSIWAAAGASAASNLIRDSCDERIIEFLCQVGLNDKSNDAISVRAHLSVALSLCFQASSESGQNLSEEGMKRILRAASILRDQSLAVSPSGELPSVVSFGSLLDIVGDVFTRADEGIGEMLDEFRHGLQTCVWRERLSIKPDDKKESPSVSPLHRPALHPTWYIGDGLLLPPREALSQCIFYCRKMLGGDSRVEDAAMELYRFVAARGARSMALRLLCSSASVRSSSPGSMSMSQVQVICSEVAAGMSETIRSLAERSLGGTGTGITSSLIDSQLAASFLLSLPVKVAFRVYKSSLPTAVKTHDFARVSTLANVGKAISSESDTSHGKLGFFAVGWHKQSRFSYQCRHLAVRAQWWTILRKYGVDFDPQRFDGGGADDRTGTTESARGEAKYVASLIPELVAGMSRTLSTPDVVHLSTMFAATFGLQRDQVIQRYIEFLLSPPTQDNTGNGLGRSRDVRFDLDRCERTAKALLRLLQPAMKQSAVLRRCLVTLEGTRTCDQDYERFSLVLCLYHESLVHVVDRDLTVLELDPMPFEAELELIDRRRDALAILSSFFQGEKALERPPLTSLFLPLAVPFNHDSAVPQLPTSGILGVDARNQDSFDPLQPLEDVLSSSHDLGTATALAPLCLPLGLPQGYIHARALMGRFRKSFEHRTAFPSFENDVIPVFNRIRLTHEKAVLAEWCAAQYVNSDEEKLKCLDLALHSAMQASTELEQHRHRNSRGDDRKLEELEINALEAVKRITSLKAALFDRLRVKSTLRSVDSMSQGAVTLVTEELIRLMELEVKENSDLSPEQLVDFLLSTGSVLAANASMDDNVAFSTSQFRRFATGVHEACKGISEEHSHIHCGRRAKRFARAWLFYGDDSTKDGKVSTNIEPHHPVVLAQPTGLMDIEEEPEDTIDFVMDLSDLQGEGDGWGDDIGPGKTMGQERFTSEEEPSALKAVASREVSELSSGRAALRIAFVMGFVGDNEAATDNDENSRATSNRSQPNKSETKRVGLLARVVTTRDSRQDVKVLDLSRELLRIVFAKPGVSSNLFSRSSSFEMDTTTVHHDASDGQKTITFAMRHRALRTASILCPQEALEQVAKEEGFLRTDGIRAECSLRQCTFGVFVAKEIEEMGLPLPHSDLGQLSSMHFLSYARALWRHHRDGDIKGSKGRLLLLLLEMSLRDNVTDAAFLDSLLNEMAQIYLPRTLLLAAERIVPVLEQRKGSIDTTSLTRALVTAAKPILSELHRVGSSEELDDEDAMSSLTTVRRLGKVAVALSDSVEGQQQLQHFVNVLNDIAQATTNEILSEGLSGIQSHALRRLETRLGPRVSPSLPTDTATSLIQTASLL